MKVLVTYYSQTGNTEKLARSIYEAIHVEKELHPIQEVNSVEGFDVIFVGFPVHAHSVPAKALPFFKTCPRDRTSPSSAHMVRSGAANFPSRRWNTRSAFPPGQRSSARSGSGVKWM